MASKSNTNKLYRSTSNKVIAGICGGLGDYFNIDPAILRVVFVLITIFGGGGILIYLVLWVVMPQEGKTMKAGEDYIKDNVEEIKTRSKEIAGKDHRPFLGIAIVVVGLTLLFNNLGFHYFNFIGKLWPLIIVALGISLLTKSKE